MKKIFLYSFILFGLFSTSCLKKIDKPSLIQFELYDSLLIKIQNKNFQHLRSVNYSEKDNSLAILLGSSYRLHPVLYLYDARNGVYKDSIDFSALIANNSELMAINYLSRDSIFLFLMKHNSNLNDSIILLANSKGHLVKAITPRHPFLASHFYSENNSSLIMDFFYNKPLLIKNKIFFTMRSYYDDWYFKPDSVRKSKRPVIGYYDFVNDITVLNSELLYPANNGIFNSGLNESSFTINEKGNPVVGFAYTPDLLEWDLNTGKVNVHKIASLFLDSIIPDEHVNKKQMSETQPYFSDISYNPYLKLYQRTIYFPTETFGNLENIEVFADSEFRSVGEKINQKIFGEEVNGWHYDYTQNLNDEVLTFYKIKPVYKTLDTAHVSKEIYAFKREKEERISKAKCSIGVGNKANSKYQSADFVKYANGRLSIKDSSFVIFSVQENSCPGCVTYILDFFSANQSVLKGQGFYLLYVSDDYQFTKRELKKIHLDAYPNFRNDSSYFYQVFHPFVSDNPRLIVVKNNIVELDSIYPSENMVDMVLKSMEMNGLEKK